MTDDPATDPGAVTQWLLDYRYAEIDIQPPAGYEAPPPRVEQPVPQPLTATRRQRPAAGRHPSLGSGGHAGAFEAVAESPA
jgi:hypothetical protein